MFFMLIKLREIVYVDICGLFLLGGLVLVLIDGFFRLLEIEIFYNIIVEVLISYFDKIFVIYGYLEELIKDNGF